MKQVIGAFGILFITACAGTPKAPLTSPSDSGIPQAKAGQWMDPGSFDPKKQIPALRKVYSDDRKTLIRVETDFNTDGRVDFVQFYDPSGTWVQRERADLDGDGRFDVTYTYERSAGKKPPHLVLEEFDVLYQGKANLWKYYGPGGELVKRALDRNGDGKEDYWEYYRNSRLVRSERDDDGDGIPDFRPQFRFRSLGTR